MWEYKTANIRFSHEDCDLAKYGKDNWELVAISNGRFYFKRHRPQVIARDIRVVNGDGDGQAARPASG